MPAIPHLLARPLHKHLNFAAGFGLLRDRSVPARFKLFALSLGLAATLLLEALEIPLESVLAVLLPFIGPALDLAFDGIEFIVLPLLFASLFIQRFKFARQGP